ncbi:MAG: tail fiber domain-containing protein, partial [Bacteroidia bacterium]
NKQVLKYNSNTLQWEPAADSSTTYTAGTGISLTGSTINSVWTSNGSNIYNNNTSNVGIGTLSPNAKLDVLPSTANAINIQPFGIAAGSAGEIRFDELSANGLNYTGFKAADNITANRIYTLPAADGSNGQVLSTNGSGIMNWITAPGTNALTGNGTATQIAFYNGANTLTSNSNLKWDNSNGRLGIGISSPAVTLDINGDIALNDHPIHLRDGGNNDHTIGYAADVDGPAIIGYDGGGLGTTGNPYSLTWTYTGDVKARNNFVVDEGATGDGSFNNGLRFGSNSGEGITSDRNNASLNPSGLDFFTASNKRMVITNGGDIGIGTDQPSAKLEITPDNSNALTLNPSASGNTGALRFKELNGNGADFVALKSPDSLGVSTTYTLPASDGISGQVLVTDGGAHLFWNTISGGGVANTALSNLTPTSISQSLIAASDNTIDLGASAKGWKNIYMNGNLMLSQGGASARLLWIGNAVAENLFLGIGTGNAASPGSVNTFVGNSVGIGTTGTNNSFFGDQAGHANGSGSYNVFAGGFAGFSNTTANNNTFIGAYSGFANSTGTRNTFLGFVAGKNNNSNDNVFIGDSSGYLNMTGQENVFIGTKAGRSSDVIAGAVYIGYNAGYNSFAVGNTFTGWNSGFTNKSGNTNTFYGYTTGYLNTSGSSNSFFGNAAGYNTTTDCNTFLGYHAGYNNTTGYSNTFIGCSADNLTGTVHNTTIIGSGATSALDNDVRIGDGNITHIGGQVNWSAGSDARLKKDVKDYNLGLDFIMKLRPVAYKFISHGADAQYYHGFIAQEVEKALNDLHTDFSGLCKPQNDKDFYSLRYAEFVVPIVNAIKEQQQEITHKDSLIDLQQKQLSDQQQQINELKNQMFQLTGWISQCCEKMENNPQVIKPASSDMPRLEQNQPNPFTEKSIIRFYIPSSFHSAQIIITDLSGQQLKSYNIKNAGFGEIIIHANEFAAGNYLYSLIVDGAKVDSKKMELTK